MKQLLQNLRDGKALVVDVPVPTPKPGTVLVRNATSLISAGTERMVVDFAGKSLVGKARSRPDLVRQVLDKARREGFLTTLEAVFNRLDQPMALGYSCAGTVVAVGAGVEGLEPGDRVACAGGGYAVHAEYVVIPKNLLAALPEQVDFESAAFTTLGAIALHGFRLAEVQLGERIAVIGLGLLGLLSVGIARAAGCTVFGVDLDPQRVALAEQLGAIAVQRLQAEESGRSLTQGRGFDAVLICADTPASDPVELAGILARDRAKVIAVGAVGMSLPRKLYYEKELQLIVSRSYGPGRYDPQRVALAEQMGAIAVQRLQAEESGRSLTQGRGFDAVLICADTPASDPVELAGVLARERAKVIAVGAVGLSLPRKLYYEKELQLIVSRSYGPGRYDPQYEEKGIDYPFGYVRWTEGRNLQAVVDLLASGKLDVKPLITHRFSIEQGEAAYDLISGKSRQPFLGVLLTYPHSREATAPLRRVELSSPAAPLEGLPGLGVLGAGNYATAVFLPVVQRSGGVQKLGIASASGLSARHAAQRYGFGFASSQENDILGNPQIQVVAILTRHQHHARQVIQALRAGQHVFCEKPLAITPEELNAIQQLLEEKPPALLTVGFNRRFAPFSRQLARFLENRREPMFIHYRVNAGYLPMTHWLHDPQQGGGRIVGEGCHFIDYLTFLVGKPPLRVRTVGLPDGDRYRQDNVCMTFTFEDGSIGTVTYLANGDKSLPKERVEVFCAGRVAVLEDYRSLELLQNGQRQKFTARLRQDKGHQALWEAFVQAVRQGGPPPIPYNYLLSVTRASFAAVESLHQQADVEINQA